MNLSPEFKARLKAVAAGIAAHPGRNLTVLLITLIVLVLNWWFPVIRFARPALNAAVGLFMILVVALLTLNGLLFRHKVVKIACIVVFGSYLLASQKWNLDGTWTLWPTFRHGVDLTFVPIRTVELDRSAVTAYRTMAGDMVTLGVTVRQETNILPGMNLVRNICRVENCEDIVLERIAPDLVQVDSTIVELKPHIYF